MILHRTTSRPHSSSHVLLRIALVVLFAGAFGCSSPPPQITLEAPQGEISPVFIGAGSLYLKIRNAGGRDTLIGAEVAVPGAVIELHDVRERKMVRVEKFDIPARQTLELAPGSLHIMVFNMPKTVKAGSEISLTMRFERSGARTVPVRFHR